METQLTETQLTETQLTETEHIKSFLLGVNALFTMVGVESRFTYKVKQLKRDPDNVRAVYVLSGPNNTADYMRIGTIRVDLNEFEARNSLTPSARAFNWVFARLVRGLSIAPVQVLHHGRCCKCGRTLTTPESIQSGIGPICAGL
jgi:NADH:ubiquinone oxidoreductase subunit D